LTPTAGAIVSSPGQSGTATVSVTPNGGFTGTASLTCTPDPRAAETTCSLTSGTTTGSPLQVTVPAAGVNVSLNVTTTASHQVSRLDSPPVGRSSELALAAMLFLLVPFARPHRKYFLCFIALALTLGITACGGGGSGGGSGGGGGNTDPGTTAGSYEFTVTATAGSGAGQVTISTPVSVVVN
jgi:hypothetical protein